MFERAAVGSDNRSEPARVQKFELGEIDDDVVLALVGRFDERRTQRGRRGEVEAAPQPVNDCVTAVFRLDVDRKASCDMYLSYG